jgi:hypothetical protein
VIFLTLTCSISRPQPLRTDTKMYCTRWALSALTFCEGPKSSDGALINFSHDLTGSSWIAFFNVSELAAFSRSTILDGKIHSVQLKDPKIFSRQDPTTGYVRSTSKISNPLSELITHKQLNDLRLPYAVNSENNRTWKSILPRIWNRKEHAPQKPGGVLFSGVQLRMAIPFLQSVKTSFSNFLTPAAVVAYFKQTKRG